MLSYRKNKQLKGDAKSRLPATLAADYDLAYRSIGASFHILVPTAAKYWEMGIFCHYFKALFDAVIKQYIVRRKVLLDSVITSKN